MTDAVDPGPKRSSFAARALVALFIAGSAAIASVYGARSILPEDGRVAVGARVGGVPIKPGATPKEAAEDQVNKILDRRITLRWEGKPVLEASLGELGASIDVDSITRHLGAIAHQQDLIARLDDALLARAGLLDVPVRAHVPVDALAALLERFKDERDAPPASAKLNFADHTAMPHAPGRYIDIYGAAAAVERAALTRDTVVDIPVLQIAPRASSDVVAKIDVSQVISSFETRFGYLGNQAGRAKNVSRAAEGVEGAVLLPGEVLSFNANVGARSVENGFTTAPEIYKGELRDGVGGGTCQVAGTLHAAAFLGGLDIMERANHSRPSGYIKMGLDATVVYPTVDLKLRNPFDFPIAIHRTINKGVLTFEIRGRAKPVTVEMDTQTIGVAAFKRKIEDDFGVKEGAVVLKQKGIKGFTVRKVRTIHMDGREARVEVSTDVYPPTFEIWKARPGTDVDAILPPLAGEAGADTTPAAAPAEPSPPRTIASRSSGGGA